MSTTTAPTPLPPVTSSFMELQTAVAEETTVLASSTVLIEGINEKMKGIAQQANVHPSEVKALSDQLEQSTEGLAAAVQSNVPHPQVGLQIADEPNNSSVNTPAGSVDAPDSDSHRTGLRAAVHDKADKRR